MTTKWDFVHIRPKTGPGSLYQGTGGRFFFLLISSPLEKRASKIMAAGVFWLVVPSCHFPPRKPSVPRIIPTCPILPPPRTHRVESRGLCRSAGLRRGRIWMANQGATGQGRGWQLSLWDLRRPDCLKAWDGVIRTRKIEWVGKEIQNSFYPSGLGPGYRFQFPALGLTGQYASAHRRACHARTGVEVYYGANCVLPKGVEVFIPRVHECVRERTVFCLHLKSSRDGMVGLRPSLSFSTRHLYKSQNLSFCMYLLLTASLGVSGGYKLVGTFLQEPRHCSRHTALCIRLSSSEAQV